MLRTLSLMLMFVKSITSSILDWIKFSPDSHSLSVSAHGHGYLTKWSRWILVLEILNLINIAQQVEHLKVCLEEEYAAQMQSAWDWCQESGQTNHRPNFLIPTGSIELDQLLHGGILSGHITELVGQVASGKTQLCLSIAVQAVIDHIQSTSQSHHTMLSEIPCIQLKRNEFLKIESGSHPYYVQDLIRYRVWYIDSGNNFSSQRCYQLAINQLSSFNLTIHSPSQFNPNLNLHNDENINLNSSFKPLSNPHSIRECRLGQCALHQAAFQLLDHVICFQVSDIFMLINLLEQLWLVLESDRHPTGQRATIPEHSSPYFLVGDIRLVVIDSLNALLSPIILSKLKNGRFLILQVVQWMKQIATQFSIAFVTTNYAVQEIQSYERQLAPIMSPPLLKPALGKYWSSIPSMQILVQHPPLIREGQLGIREATLIKSVQSATKETIRFNISSLSMG